MSRVAMYVNNDCTRDARVLREARSLAEAGHDVTIVARLSGDVPALEERNGFRILRVPTPRAWARTWKEQLAYLRYPWRARAAVGTAILSDARRGPRTWIRLAARLLSLPFLALWTVYRLVDFRLLGDRGYSPGVGGGLDVLVRWERGTLGWAAAAAAAAPSADVHHGHDLPGLAAAAGGQARLGGKLVYDSHELFMEAGSVALRPWWVRRQMRREETRLIRRADAVVTVNDALAERLSQRYGLHGVLAVHNCPARWSPPTDEPDHLRAAAQIDGTVPVVLYHGGLMPHRGLEQLVDAMGRPQLAGVHAVFLGYGSARPDLERRIAASPARQRLHVLDAVDPDVLPAWIRFADVGAMPIQPSTINHVLSTPNKLFECLAVGVPVVASDFAGMRRIVIDDPDGPLGAVCDPTDPDEIAAAIHGVLALPDEERTDLRARALRAAHERWNWETESQKLVDLYRSLIDGAPRDAGSASRG